jgi:hypothetical protein
MARKDKPESAFSWSSFGTALASFGLFVMLLALLAGVILGQRPLEKRAASLPGARATKIEIHWPKAKPSDGGAALTWVPERERDALHEIALLALSGDLERYSSDPLERVGKAMASSGWFTDRPTITRSVGGKIEVDGHWRVPAAVVRRDGVDQLISWDGFPMPITAQSGTTAFPVIHTPSLPPPPAGAGKVDFNTAWPGEDIAASLELLALLLRQPWANQVAGVDLASFPVQRSLAITTTFGTRVVWGGRATRPALGEVSSEQKLAHIGELFAKHQRIDAGYPMIFVNNAKLQFDISASAQALAMQGVQTDPAPVVEPPRKLPPARIAKSHDRDR